MASQRILVLGTRNKKKRQELEELLVGHGLVLHTLDDYPNSLEIDEDGETFAANARKKASVQARHLGRWVLGEDSGLAVDALGGAPGVYSARYSASESSGVGATDASNNAKLLAQLAGVPLEKRTAHYVCHAALADPSGVIRAASEGTCNGRILLRPAGEGGFGYDPLFEVVEYHLTFGQLGGAVKAVLSHRSRAMRQIALQIASFID